MKVDTDEKIHNNILILIFCPQ